MTRFGGKSALIMAKNDKLTTHILVSENISITFEHISIKQVEIEKNQYDSLTLRALGKMPDVQYSAEIS